MTGYLWIMSQALSTPVCFRSKHFDAFRPSLHTKTLSVFGETASIWKRSRKWIQMKTHTYRVDSRKRIEMKTDDVIRIMWVVPRLLRPREINIMVSLLSMFILRHTQFSGFKRFSADSWKRYKNGSADADRSMQFRCHRKRSQMKTQYCGQGLRLQFL